MKSRHHINLKMERTTGLDEKAKEHGSKIYVALFWQHELDITAKWSGINGWAVTTKKSERRKGADSFKVVIQPKYMRKLQDRKPSILSSPYLEVSWSITEAFKKGKPLISLSTPIRDCAGKSRPRVLYRVVHGGHPGKGLWSRGFGACKTDRMSFMLLFQRHLNWKCRNASPFMSTTTDPVKMVRLAAWYESNGFSNIEVLVIRVDDSKWPSQSRIWDVTKTATSLCLSGMLRKPFYDHEYLIENCIPEPCVTRIRWEEMKAIICAKASEMRRSKKRKRAIFESDGPGNETMLSDGRSKRVWGVVKDTDRRPRQP